jgi:hypothetical protein
MTNLQRKPFMQTTQKAGLMNRVRRGALVVGLATSAFTLASLGSSHPAFAQEITGRVTGRVSDQDTGAALAGVTVIVQGPQGEDATITDDKGLYQFTGLGVGTYTIRFYMANSATQVEQPGVVVSAEKTVRVNAKIATQAQAAAQQTYVITGKAPVIDVGSARVGTTFDEDYTLHLAVGPTFGDVIAKAPGVFVDGSGNISIGGATGLENIYIVNGLNVTGLRFGNLEAGVPSYGGGTNLPNEFLTQIDVNSGGYQAEFGGALGGVINTVLKSGSNEFHGSVFGSYAPYWLSASPTPVQTIGGAIGGVRKPDFDDRIGFEVGGPIIPNKLFFWAGMAPQITDDHRFRLTYQQQENGSAPVLLAGDTQRLNETHRTYSYAANIDFIPKPDHKLTLSIMGTPNFNNQLRSFTGFELDSAFPSNGQASWAQESLTKTNTDVSAHWTSKLFDRHWTIEALGGFHDEYLYDRSPSSTLNNLNQLEYYGSNLGTLENLPGCQAKADGFQPCPVNPPFYSAGGFGQITKYTGNRWQGELKSTHDFEGGGRHELKYGWHLEYSTLDLERHYSGPPGDHSTVWFQDNGAGAYGVNTQNYFKLLQNQYPTDFGGGGRYPLSDLSQNPLYADQLNADVKSISNALFLQDTWSPAFLRNLSINAGLRYENQKLYDLNGASFINANNLGPRIGAVFDPFNDGKSKISAAYGRFYEAIPLDLAARYFGGENYIQRYGVPSGDCANSNPYSWTGAGEYRGCPIPAPGQTTLPNGQPDPSTGAFAAYNSALKAPKINGEFQNEVVATIERQVMDDMSVRLDYTHRWLGDVVEDGYGTTGVDTLTNPGNVPPSALTSAANDVTAANKAAMSAQTSADMAAKAAAAMPTNTGLQTAAANAQAAALNAQGAASNAQTTLATLQSLASAPKPERTYDALTLTLNKRFAKQWFVRGSYTYSRLVGNYEGLFQNETGYFAPNATNSFDSPDLYLNSRGYLPNDHTHQGKIDGYYALPVGPGTVTFGLSFVARSGMPRNYISNLFQNSNYQIVDLLPRGSAGRTPWVTQLDGHISYEQHIRKNLRLQAFVDLFNMIDQQAALQQDDNYTYDGAAPIVNGTPSDLKFAKNSSGNPIVKNPNFGQTVVYQTPFYTRMGMRLMF